MNQKRTEISEYIYIFFYHISVQLSKERVEEPTLTLFISSQHPDFDVGFSQLFDGVWDTVLQFVLHSSRP